MTVSSVVRFDIERGEAVGLRGRRPEVVALVEHQRGDR